VKRMTKTIARSSLLLLVALLGACSPLVVDTALTRLRDGTADVAVSAVQVFFESRFGIPAEEENSAAESEEENGNDLFIRL